MINILLIIIGTLLSSILYADAIISVESTTYDYGSVIEEETNSVKYQIPVKNTGDSPLKITNIRKTCGCTSVKYDSVIMPGKTSIIQPVINIRGRVGKQTKYIYVQSNATNNNNLKIGLEVFIERYINPSSDYIKLNSGQKHPITFASKNDNLKIENVYFIGLTQYRRDKKEYGKTYNIDFGQTEREGIDKFNQYYYYTIELLFNEKISDRISGEFVFETNHPKKHELRLKGVLTTANNKNE